MKQADVVASLARCLMTILPLTFVILKQCNGSIGPASAGSTIFEIPSKDQKRFLLTDCKKPEAENIYCKCKSLGRDCRSNDTKYCENCRCLSGQTYGQTQYRTFYIKKGNRALCLSTNNLLKAAGFGNPFLVYNYPGKVCARINETRKRSIYYSRTCNSRDLRQLWVWTPGNLLMNLFNHQCLEVEKAIKSFRSIHLSPCDSSRNDQKWRCNNRLCFGISSEKFPINLTHTLSYYYKRETLLAVQFGVINVGNFWTVYPEGNKSVCAARSPEGHLYVCRSYKTSPQIELQAKCSTFGCSKVLSNSLNVRNLTTCEILWEDSSWLDMRTKKRTFWNGTQPGFTFKNYKDRLYFEWKFDPYSSLAGALVNLTIECLVTNSKFQEFSFHFMIKEVIYQNITERYQFIQNNKTDLNITILNLNNGCVGSVCSRQIAAPLKLNKSQAVCVILWKESTFMRNGSSDWINFDNITELFCLNNDNNSLRLEWKLASISLLNKTTFNLTILCSDDQNDNYTIAEKSQIIFQSVGKDIKGKSSSEKPSELLKIVLPVTLILFVLLVLLLVFCCWYQCRRKRRTQKSNKHSTSKVNLQINMERDNLGARFNEGDDDPCYEECRATTTHPAVTIARNQLYESASFAESRPDSKIYEKPIQSVKVRRKVFEDKSPKTADYKHAKARRPPPPKPSEVKKVEQEIPPYSGDNSSQDETRDETRDETYCEPLGVISDNYKDNKSPGVLEVPSKDLDNRLSSPYLKPLPASPDEDNDNVYDYVTRVEIEKGTPKSPRHQPDRKIFKVTAEEGHVGSSENDYDSKDSHLYATLDHGVG